MIHRHLLQHAHDADHRWQHPWLRIQLLLRSMLGTRWDAKTWPTIKAEMKKALEMRSKIPAVGVVHAGRLFRLATYTPAPPSSVTGSN